MDDLQLRPADREDTDAICALLGGIFPDNPKADPATLTWQYWDDPFGPTRSWVAVDDDEVVAHYAAYAVPGRLDGAPVTASWGADAATAASHRGRGLFTELARSVYEDCGRHGMPVTLCNPNPASLPGAQRAGLVPVDDVPVYVRPLDDAWLSDRFALPTSFWRAARSVVFRSRAGDGGRRVDGVPDGLDDLWGRVGTTVSSGIVSDGDWWRWRYAQRPGTPYRFYEVRRAGRLVAAAVAAHRHTFDAPFVQVLELLAEGEDDAAAVLEAAAEDRDGAVGIGLIALPGDRTADLAGAAGFRRLPRRLEPLPVHFGVVPNAEDLPPVDRLRWSIPWGLFDHL